MLFPFFLRRLVLTAAIGVGAILPAPPATAQDATLQHREDELLISIRDRSGAFGGMWFDRGILRRYMPEMDHEYDLDVRGARFSTDEDAQWFSVDHAIRTYAASVSKSAFATVTDMRHRFALADRHLLTFRARQQEDARARRYYIEGGYAFAVRPQHQVGFTQTMGSFKPDLDAELYYETRDTPAGDVRVSVFILDAFNNMIFDGLGVDPVLQDTLRSYTKPPRLLRARWLSPSFGRLSLEAFAGVQPRAEAILTTHSDALFRMRVGERFGYGMLNVKLDIASVHLNGYAASWRERSDFSGSGGRYSVVQRETNYGLGARSTIPVNRFGGLAVSGEVALSRYEDRQSGSDFSGATIPEPFRVDEDRLETALRLLWEPRRKGLRAGVRWISDGRFYEGDLDVLERHFLRFAQWSPNTRVSLLIGYDYRPWFRLEAGASLDVDGDRFYTDRGATRFDGGFGRVQLLW